MPTVAQIVNHPDFADLTTTFLDSAAAIETRLHDTELRVHSLERKLRHAQQCHERARQGILALRRSHRHDSHAATGKLFKRVLDHLAALDTMPFGSER